MQKVLEKLNKFLGAVIALNILHQIISSAGYLTLEIPFLQILYSASIGLFAIEFFIRAFVERRTSFLLLIDGMVLINQVFFSIYDLRILRLFRKKDRNILKNEERHHTGQLLFMSTENNHRHMAISLKK